MREDLDMRMSLDGSGRGREEGDFSTRKGRSVGAEGERRKRKERKQEEREEGSSSTTVPPPPVLSSLLFSQQNSDPNPEKAYHLYSQFIPLLLSLEIKQNPGVLPVFSQPSVHERRLSSSSSLLVRLDSTRTSLPPLRPRSSRSTICFRDLTG